MITQIRATTHLHCLSVCNFFGYRAANMFDFNEVVCIYGLNQGNQIVSGGLNYKTFRWDETLDPQWTLASQVPLSSVVSRNINS